MTEIPIFKAKKYNTSNVLSVVLVCTMLRVVDRYLGHMITGNMKVHLDVERERKAFGL